MATEKIICSGFGGQGIMSMGQLLAYAGMLEGKEVSWLPSYGPEMRGGTANCSVIVSDKPVGSPVVTNDCTTAIVMNLPSLLKFEQAVVEGGNLLINSSLIDEKAKREDIKAYYVPANEIALEIGNIKVANMVMLGAYLELTKIVKVETVIEALRKVFGPSKEKLIPINEQALERGAACVR
ncbi:2-oxoglutarate ferredoxin oxidoreductase subunit gamma [Alkalithermobacter thermoalcaliphilus JW-YL-7 = DSM 7308]|uniref:2-oxoglutarate ferredoxin oxidoreductase subunit gamma n=1 Tax=Alkalithermobacter thermoalcaliphilus JW-YL-7 = DSM 7308 TaxID=1121328 RepID=A0A150FN13_CLOPD|nr:pyruvate/ketoisovalerate oxidoreductase, gamma subunit [[Clostridium] paradoxum JW-YL-7 = DSM 7308]SHL36329.1 2-oxoglutarate ferredoxin oxidoreductase subunit gamma [[Clostridium] paradoxum JW-YL-7 = DSM 7308]